MFLSDELKKYWRFEDEITFLLNADTIIYYDILKNIMLFAFGFRFTYEYYKK